MKAILFILIGIISFPLNFQNSYLDQSSINNPWSTTDWEVECMEILQSYGGEYYLDMNGSDECKYIKRTDESEYIISEDEKTRLARYLKMASIMLEEEQFNEPIIQNTGGKWKVQIYPPDCACSGRDCCADTDEEGNLINNQSSIKGFYEEPELHVKSIIGGESHGETIVTAVHELFHGVQASHYTDRQAVRRNENLSWIHEGSAEGFAWFWSRYSGVTFSERSYREYDFPLYMPKNEEGNDLSYGTAEFWEYIARKQFSYGFMKDILDNINADGNGVIDVHNGLISSGLDKGLYNGYLGFVKDKLNDPDKFSKKKEKDIDAIDEEFELQIEEIKPIATEAILIKIDPSQLPREDIEEKKISLVVELPENISEDAHLFFGNKKIEQKFTLDITEKLRNSNGEIAYFFRMANVNEQPNNTNTLQNEKLKIKLETLECPLLPEGIATMTYEHYDDRNKKLGRYIYHFNAQSTVSESQEGNIRLDIYSYEQEQIIAKSFLDFECTEEGIVLVGPQYMNSPGLSGYGTLNMSILTNTNQIPHKPEVGSTLDNANVVVHANSENEVETGSDSKFDVNFGMDMNVNITNRKVVSKETITVPAGSFECYRIEYDSDLTVTFSGMAVVLNLVKRKLEREGNAHSTIWVTENHGWVKQEIRNRSGTSYMELVSLND